jgi:hypothetical protein
VANDIQNILPPPPPIAPGLPGGPPLSTETRPVIAVQIGIEEYKELMAILQELPYRVSGPVMNKLAPGVKAIFDDDAEIVDDPDKEGAE